MAIFVDEPTITQLCQYLINVACAKWFLEAFFRFLNHFLHCEFFITVG